MEVAGSVVGALLAVPFEKLIEKLASPGMRQVTSEEVRAQLKKWEDMLPMIQAALEDAEDQQITSRVVEMWLKDLRDLIYDVDDVLDEFATEDLRLKSKNKQAAVSAAAAAASACSSQKARKILFPKDYEFDMNGLVQLCMAEGFVPNLIELKSNLKRLAISSYYGRQLPSWIADPLLMSNMVELELCNCSEIRSLPSFGRLPILKHLIIDGMMAVKSVRSELYGCDSGFLALETLKLKNMQGLEEWCLSEREGEGKFPSLCFLEISNCPSLVATGVVSHPSLCELKLEECIMSASSSSSSTSSVVEYIYILSVQI